MEWRESHVFFIGDFSREIFAYFLKIIIPFENSGIRKILFNLQHYAEGKLVRKIKMLIFRSFTISE